jgi:methyl-accepting chemotaxis protein
VAEEVRTLARRSAESAKSTGKTLAEATTRTRQGARANDDVRELFERIQQRVSRLHEVAAAIAESSARQRKDGAEVESAIDKIAEVTTAVAAVAEEQASAATEMSEQSASAASMAAQFRTSDAGAATHAEPHHEPIVINSLPPPGPAS